MNAVISQHYRAIVGELGGELLKLQRCFSELSDTVTAQCAESKIIQAETRFCRGYAAFAESLALFFEPLPPLSTREENFYLRLFFYCCAMEKLTRAVEMLRSRWQSAESRNLPAAKREYCRRKTAVDALLKKSSGKKNDFNILLCGSRGSGKSSLIKAVVSDDPVSESAADRGRVYHFGKITFRESSSWQDDGSAADCIWYCIDGSAGKLAECDIETVRNCEKKMLLVVTKRDLIRKEHTRSLMEELLKLTTSERIVIVSAENGTGLCRLLEKSSQLSKKRRNICCSVAWEKWRNNSADEVDRCIRWAVESAAKSSTSAADEIYMICKIAAVYGVAVNAEEVDMLRQGSGGDLRRIGQAAKSYFESAMPISAADLHSLEYVSD